MRTQRTSGFTLVELIVSLGVFATTVLLAAGAYLIMVSIDRKAQAVAAGVDNLSFALETMARTIRTSRNFTCLSSESVVVQCSEGNITKIRVTPPDGTPLIYELTYNAAYKNSAINQRTNSASSQLTDYSLVDVTSLTFYVSGEDPTDALQPYVTIVAQGEVVSDAGSREAISIETGATMRGTDL